MPERPNVLLVLADQWRGGALGCAGDPNVRTPAIDGLAEEGVHCERAYTPNPVCTPARAALLTGQFPHENGVVFNNLRLPGDATTLAECLREVGYRTGYVGKWHLDGEPGPGYVPPERRRGFDFWRGFNRGHEHLKGHPHMNPDGSADWEEGYQPAVQTDIAREFVADHRAGDADRPFFLTVSWGPPHTPFEAPDEYSRMYDPEELELRENVPDDVDTAELRADLAEYYALITSLDDQMARLLDALDEHGAAEDTLVVFTSDHGEQLGSQGRQRKGYPFEESVRVPLVARYPGEFPSHRTGGLVSLLDLFPTLCALCDAPEPDGVQGEDRSALLRGEGGGADALYLEGCLAFDDAWRAVRTDDELLVVDRALSTQYLFADEYQTENLAGDPAHADRERRLRDRLLELAREHGDRRVMATDAATRMSSMDSLLVEHEDTFDRPVVGEKAGREPPD